MTIPDITSNPGTQRQIGVIYICYYPCWLLCLETVCFAGRKITLCCCTLDERNEKFPGEASRGKKLFDLWRRFSPRRFQKLPRRVEEYLVHNFVYTSSFPYICWFKIFVLAISSNNRRGSARAMIDCTCSNRRIMPSFSFSRNCMSENSARDELVEGKAVRFANDL